MTICDECESVVNCMKYGCLPKIPQGNTTYEKTTQEVRDAFNALCRGRVEEAVKAERNACEHAATVAISLCDDPVAAIRARGQA